MNNDVTESPEGSLQSLRGLIDGHQLNVAPQTTRRDGRWVEVVVGIGDNETAFLTMTQEAYDTLLEMTNE